ncbi:DegV family protein [Murdochiella vaginalis]|uniref:DegV family protein n=1 Tax=Murdochiella vaginalis TaxID=1852373 RepID=UPI0008FDAA69|nr:DegV family protein [Murdochiella vaginalis]
MTKYIVSGSSTADLSKAHFDAMDVKYICYHYQMDGVTYVDDLGESISYSDFYQRMADGTETKTSQINVEEFVAYFRPFLAQGLDVLHVCLSSGITGVLNSANLAKEILLNEFPERKLYIVDSLGASSGYGLLLDTMAHLRDQGMSIDELYHWTEENKLRVHHWFFSMDLSFYIKGGRISKAAGTIGQMLNICPLLNMDSCGRLTVREKIRTKRKVFKTVVDKMEQFADDGKDYAEKCYLSHSACLEDAQEVARQIEARFPHLRGKVEINSIGTTIGSHTGPGTVAVFFWGQKREE